MKDIKKVLVVGTGSIGRRHISNLKILGATVSAFSYRGPKGTAPDTQLHDVHFIESLEHSCIKNYNAVVVANSTEKHVSVALEAAQCGKALFIEKPLAISLMGIQKLQQLVDEKQLVVEAGFMLRCHPNLVWIKNFLQQTGLGSVYYIKAAVGQSLPEWRPESDYRQGYAAHRHSGGGVIFDLIHEIDLVQWLLGPVDDVSAMTRKVSQLQIETEAIAQICLKLKSGVLAQIHLDYVRPVYARSLEVVGEKGVLYWDFVTGTVQGELNGKSGILLHKVPDGFERNHMFLEHMQHFLARLSNSNLSAISSLNDSVSALKIALACHLSAAERRCVSPDEILPTYSPK